MAEFTMAPCGAILELKFRMSPSILRQNHVVERMLIGLLANDNLLVKGVPGFAKTRAVKRLAHQLKADFSRINSRNPPKPRVGCSVWEFGGSLLSLN